MDCNEQYVLFALLGLLFLPGFIAVEIYNSTTLCVGFVSELCNEKVSRNHRLFCAYARILAVLTDLRSLELSADDGRLQIYLFMGRWTRLYETYFHACSRGIYCIQRAFPACHLVSMLTYHIA